jgi:hypothetical protein
VAILANGDSRRVHEPRYSLISYPRSTLYQNSNEWLLEVIAMAQGRLRDQIILDRMDAQQLHTALGFRGTKVKVGFVDQLFGGLFKANVGFRDHPSSSSSHGGFEFISVRSVHDYLTRQNQVASAQELMAD